MTDTRFWRLLARHSCAELVLDVPGASTNTLSKAVLLELEHCLEEVAQGSAKALIIRSSKASGFAAGADIREFTALREPSAVRAQVELGHRVFDAIEALSIPTVAVLHGFCLGGGLELALACRYRVGFGDRTLAIGLPEVLLGIHPGYGGSVRSVRCIGVAEAMPLMLTGRKLKGRKAKEMGLLDKLCDSEEAALKAAEALALSRREPHQPPLLARLMSTPPLRPWVKRRLLANVQKKVRREHYPAPYALIDLWATHGVRGKQALQAEVDSIVSLAGTATAANLVRLFLLQEQLKSLGSVTGTAPRTVHVIGAGVMGADIAAWCAERGLSVTLQDRDAPSLERGLQRAEGYFSKKLRDSLQRDAARQRLRADLSGDGIAKADVVIEAIVEDLAAKRALFAAIEPLLAEGAILASNTSSIPLEQMAATLAEPARLVGLHFFNPVSMMPLVEIIHGPSTHPATIDRAIALTQAIDKLPLPCASSPGFLVNRVLVPYMFEAMRIASEGVEFSAIDQVALDFGMPVGPIELADMVGLDVCRHVGEIVMTALGRALPDLSALDQLIAAGKLGRKSGAGLYAWRDGKVIKPAVSTQAAPCPPDVSDRLMLALANEAVACWREGVVTDVDLIDAGIVFGSGYAPFRGGPLQAAATRGYATCEARLYELAAKYGERFTPDSGWSSLPTSAIANAGSPKIY
jgi:3-hydroxyacyl-CoA dehydrogenase / enoyl-CoA hydratase / 3-hydroxybutyryl-CoA epimerase